MTNGQTFVNVLHFKKTSGSIDAAALTALNTELTKLYGGASYGGGGVNLLNNCPAATVTLDVTYTPLDGSAASTVLAIAATGSGTTDLLPGETCPIITLRTALRGRSFRGRVYLPAQHDTSQSSTGAVGTGVITAYNAQLAGFITALTAINWQWVVASYLLSQATPVTTALLRNYYAVQRRRRA